MQKTEIVDKLTSLGGHVLNCIQKDENPWIDIPIRSFSNIEYDDDTGLLNLGDKKSRRYFLNLAHAKKFMQTTLVAAFCKELVNEGVHANLRELFYSLKHTVGGTKENTFDDQRESDPIVIDLEVALDVLREELYVNADRRGVAAGHVTISDRGDEIDWSKLGSGGWSIPSNVEDLQIKDANADYILVVEKNATFDRLHEDKFWDKHNCILVGTQGQAARGIRRLIRRLHQQFDLPVYVFADCDAYGFYIYSVIKIGSMNLAHVSQKLGTPAAKFLGLSMSDIEHYGLENYTIKATENDLKRVDELMKYSWFSSKPWQKELTKMKKKKIKAEQEALASKRLKFVSEEYLPEKIANKDFVE